MNERIKTVLNKIIETGYEAYIVGGYVRDYILGIESYDIDISTNAEPKIIKEIFNLGTSTEDNYGSITIKDKLYSYEITTYRKELVYENRKPLEFEYADNLETDIIRRDFTINALYMDINGKIIDLVDGIKDIDLKIIRSIGKISDKMVEDPLRMLRAIRLSSLLDFEIESNLWQFIKQNKELIITLSYNRKKEELDLIFQNSNLLKGIELIKDASLESVLNIKIDNVRPCSNYLGIWAQIDFSDEYPFTAKEKETINFIKKVIQYGIIDSIVLYQYGLYIGIIAGEILGYQKAFISEIYKDMPIYSQKDIMIDAEGIINLLNVKPGEIISRVLEDLELNILHNNLNNTKEDIEKYIIENWK